MCEMEFALDVTLRFLNLDNLDVGEARQIMHDAIGVRGVAVLAEGGLGDFAAVNLLVTPVVADVAHEHHIPQFRHDVTGANHHSVDGDQSIDVWNKPKFSDDRQ